MFTKLYQNGAARQLTAVRNLSIFCGRSQNPCYCPTVCSPASRKYSYYKSKTEESPDKYTKYEKSFKEWKFVERLMPPTHVPIPPADPNVTLPSGWKPPKPRPDCSYVIRRTKNHLVPVYVRIYERGQLRWTVIAKVEGNIWQLEKDIGRFMQDERPNHAVITRTHEISRQVFIKGDHAEKVKQWVIDQGF